MKSSEKKIVDEILNCLKGIKTRCTYGALACVLTEKLGKKIISIGVGRYLGDPRPAASWVVNAKTRKPTGYEEEQRDSDICKKDYIIKTGDELRKKCCKNN